NELLQFTYLPTRAGRVRVYDSIERPFWSYIKAHRVDAGGFSIDAYILNDAGEVVAEFLGFHGNRVDDAETRRDRLEDPPPLFPWRASPSLDEDTPAPPFFNVSRGSAFAVPFRGTIGEIRRELEPSIPELSRDLQRSAYHEAYAPRLRGLCVHY